MTLAPPQASGDGRVALRAGPGGTEDAGKGG